MSYVTIPCRFFWFAVPKDWVGKPFVLCFRRFTVVRRLRIRQGGGSRYSLELFLSGSAKNFLGRSPLFFRTFWLSNNFLPKKGIYAFSVEIFFVWWYRKTTSGNPSVLCFRNFLVMKRFPDKGGVSRFSVAIFLSHSREKFPRVILQCFNKPLISKTLWIWGGENVTVFCQKSFVSQCREKS